MRESRIGVPPPMGILTAPCAFFETAFNRGGGGVDSPDETAGTDPERCPSSRNEERDPIQEELGPGPGSVVPARTELTEGDEPVITGFSRVELPPGGASTRPSSRSSDGKFRSAAVTGVSGQTPSRFLDAAHDGRGARQAIQFEADSQGSDDDFIIDRALLDRPATRRIPLRGRCARRRLPAGALEGQPAWSAAV